LLTKKYRIGYNSQCTGKHFTFFAAKTIADVYRGHFNSHLYKIADKNVPVFTDFNNSFAVKVTNKLCKKFT